MIRMAVIQIREPIDGAHDGMAGSGNGEEPLCAVRGSSGACRTPMALARAGKPPESSASLAGGHAGGFAPLSRVTTTSADPRGSAAYPLGYDDPRLLLGRPLGSLTRQGSPKRIATTNDPQGCSAVRAVAALPRSAARGPALLRPKIQRGCPIFTKPRMA